MPSRKDHSLKMGYRFLDITETCEIEEKGFNWFLTHYQEASKTMKYYLRVVLETLRLNMKYPLASSLKFFKNELEEACRHPWKTFFSKTRDLQALRMAKMTSEKSDFGNTRRSITSVMNLFEIAKADDLLKFSKEDIYKGILKDPSGVRRRSLIHGVNVILENHGRSDRFCLDEARNCYRGFITNEQETDWWNHNGQPEWYNQFKQAYSIWLETASPVANGCARTLDGSFLSSTKLMRCMNCPPSEVSTRKINAAIIEVSTTAIQESSRSLLRRNRGHRSGEDFNPSIGRIICYLGGARLITEYLGLPKDDLISKKKANRLINGKLGEEASCIPPVNDVLTDEEMTKCLQTCRNVKENLIILLLSRMGMRIGAITNLRL